MREREGEREREREKMVLTHLDHQAEDVRGGVWEDE